ncbi:MAG TPA: hypothetical protein VIG25_05845 [Pyrinomonadaceae bacterium]|jgi:hypothetical protein
MIHDKITAIGFGLAGLFITGILVVSGPVRTVVAQDSQEPQTKKPATTKRNYSGGRDPFKRYEPPRQIKKISNQVLPPSIQERIDSYKAQKLAAMSARMPAPKPTTALLLSEIQVVGVSRTPRGYAAIIEAMPIKLSYVIYPGERFYDGQLVAIEETRLIFRHETVFTDGRREQAVEIKALRQPNTVNAMSVSGATASVSDAKP